MVSVNDTNVRLDYLRRLAQSLDIHVGVEHRKLILAGNEKLALATAEEKWSQWLRDVAERMMTNLDADTRARIEARMSARPLAGLNHLN